MNNEWLIMMVKWVVVIMMVKLWWDYGEMMVYELLADEWLDWLMMVKGA